MSSNAERIAAAVLARRAELDVTQLDVWLAGGPSNTTLTLIENGLMKNLNRTMARKLDTSLRWVPGSTRKVWEGMGDPVPLGTTSHEIIAELEAAKLSPTTLAFVKQVLAEDERRRQEEEGRRSS